MSIQKKLWKGFTLIELMVVLVIVGLLLSLATTKLDFLTPRSRLGAAARSIASSLVLAHNRAVLSGQHVAIYYNLDKNYYSLIFPSSKDKEPPHETAPNELPPGVRFENIVVLDKIQSRGSLKITITPLGMVAAHTVHLVNQEGSKVSIGVHPLTSLVEIQEGYHTFQFVSKSER